MHQYRFFRFKPKYQATSLSLLRVLLIVNTATDGFNAPVPGTQEPANAIKIALKSQISLQSAFYAR